ncbi:MAG: amidohydrolase family protein [Pseudomonadota bacterium]
MVISPCLLAVSCVAALSVPAAVSAAEQGMALVDAHIHYSHDAWEQLPPSKAVEVLRRAGLKHAFVSSSSDEGTQKLYAVAPDFIVPVLRPYRRRGELSTWLHDETVVPMLDDLLKRNRYAGIGEFHAYGEDIDLPVLQRVIQLAKQHRIFLHAHSDADAVERIFASDPDAIVLWAHSGFEDPAEVGAMLEKYPNLWADLAFRSEHESGGEVTEEWRVLFERFPKRFMLGTDTFAPERWYYVEDAAADNRVWLATLPRALAERIGASNAMELLSRTSFR